MGEVFDNSVFIGKISVCSFEISIRTPVELEVEEQPLTRVGSRFEPLHRHLALWTSLISRLDGSQGDPGFNSWQRLSSFTFRTRT